VIANAIDSYSEISCNTLIASQGASFDAVC
jgi:hypothetical protein